jgi:cyanophycinase
MCGRYNSVFLLAICFSFAGHGFGQRSSGPANGILIADGGGTIAPVIAEFVRLAGGERANIVAIPTGASSVRFGPEHVILDPDWPRGRGEWRAYEKHLKHTFRTEKVTVLHTRDRATADSEDFVKPLLQATGVYLGAGNAGRYAAAYLGTRTQRELEALLARGGVIFGSSAGAMIQGSFIVRGRPDKPLLIAKGHTQGFGFLRNVAINPHLTAAKRENELVTVCDERPGLLGIGVDEEAALVVRGDRFQLIGNGKAAIYDNTVHDGAWYYWLRPGDWFDLAAWRKLP